ncbi:hypothetical protein [Cellulomonas taurus]|uniref:hypothetical protein n=1 Tax=Cellulomonas taurus TaxID=2729175 RepID=UPI00145E5B9F|nr:hypothetical protein [Cellulomonas taurus]
MGDELRVVAVVARCGLIGLDAWPTVAAHLVGLGHGGALLAELAGAERGTTWSELEAAIPAALAELDLPDVQPAEAVSVALGLATAPCDRWELLRQVVEVLPLQVGAVEVENAQHAQDCPRCRDLDDPLVGDLLRSGTSLDLDPGLRAAILGGR